MVCKTCKMSSKSATILRTFKVNHKRLLSLKVLKPAETSDRK